MTLALNAHGVQIELPQRWSGHVFAREGNVVGVHAGSFPVVLGDGAFGDRNTGVMPSPGAFIALVEYLPGDGLEPGAGLFAAPRISLPLDPTQFAPTRLAHPHPDQTGMQHFFTTAGRPFCLYVVIAGDRAARRRQLAMTNQVLRSVQISPRSADAV